MDIFQIITTHNRPWSVLEIYVFMIIFIIVFITVKTMIKNNEMSLKQGISILLLIIYLSFIFESTVFGRASGERICQLELFWSWKEILGIGECGRIGVVGGRAALLEENLLNIAMLLPVGLLLPNIVNRRIKLMGRLSEN